MPKGHAIYFRKGKINVSACFLSMTSPDLITFSASRIAALGQGTYQGSSFPVPSGSPQGRFDIDVQSA